MEKKIGILTLFHKNYNYGAVLQAYALQKGLEHAGFSAEVIDYERFLQPLTGATRLAFAQRLKRKLLIRSFGDFIDLAMRPFGRWYDRRYAPMLKERERKFDAFCMEHMNISAPYNMATIEFANNDYDAFVCGSDQVWRPSSFDPNFFLAFAADGKQKFSYSASLGVSELPEKAAEKMLPLIDKLDRVAVREGEAKRLLQPYTEREIQTTLDPTLLWDASFWNRLAKKPENLKQGSYIFCYLIGENNGNRAQARRVAKTWGLPLAAIPAVSRVLPYDMMYADQNLMDASPDEFLGLIQNAAAVVTDSFHACVFSIIFDKPFYALERFSQKDKNSMNGRIYDLLSLFQMEDCLLTADMPVSIKGAAHGNRQRYEERRRLSWEYIVDAYHAENTRKTEPIQRPRVFAVQSIDPEVRKNSSSGGVFFHLAKKVLANGGGVIACRLDEQGRAVHALCETEDELPHYMTSKYVQSRIGASYIEAGKLLRSGRTLLFVGTPCQIAGLRNYLKLKKIAADRLLAVDIICHGVPSPLIWEKYYDETADKEHVCTASFRDKREGWRKFSLVIRRKEEAAGKCKEIYAGNKENDLYLRGFLGDCFLRPSCYACKFKSTKHISDLTLGDFWHYERCGLKMRDDDTGISLVLCQSEKGLDFITGLDGLSMEESECEILSIANKSLLRSPTRPASREHFFSGFNSFSEKAHKGAVMHEYLKCTLKKSMWQRAKDIVKRILGR